jgi:hypothetical protein
MAAREAIAEADIRSTTVDCPLGGLIVRLGSEADLSKPHRDVRLVPLADIFMIT